MGRHPYPSNLLAIVLIVAATSRVAVAQNDEPSTAPDGPSPLADSPTAASFLEKPAERAPDDAAPTGEDVLSPDVIGGWLQRRMELPLWILILSAALAVICVVIAFYFGFWRGSTLPVRALATMAFLVATGNIAVVTINELLRVEIAQLDGKAYLLLAFLALCFTIIEVFPRRAAPTTSERQLQLSTQALLLASLDQWVEDTFPGDGDEQQLRKSVVRAIVTMDYPDNKLVESPSIRWPAHYRFSDKWQLVRSVWKSLQQQKDGLIARMTAESTGMIEQLQQALDPRLLA